jgi:tRNA 2-thiouridine synthesizing protein B
VLHIVSHSLSDTVVLERITPGDAVLFIRNAVLGLSKDGRFVGKLQELQRYCKLNVLRPDLELRGIALETLVAGIEPVDYGGFVALVVEYPAVYSWC